MDRATVLSTVGAAIVLGAVIAVVPDGQTRLSVDLWLVGVAALAGTRLARQALGTVPGERDRLRPLVRFHRRHDPPEPAVPRDLAALEGSLLASANNPRSYHFRLRPRLRDVTRHRLRTSHGVDLDREPERATEMLGDVAWLIDESEMIGNDGRAPRPTELATLLDHSEPKNHGRDR